MARASQVALAALLAALLLTVGAEARASSFTIDVGIPGQQPLHLTPDVVETSPGVFHSSSEATVAGSFQLSWDVVLHGDPLVSGSFTLTNLTDTAHVFSVAATLGVVPIPSATRIGGSFGDVVLTDGNDGLAILDGNPFYEARIDGVAVKDLGPVHIGPGPGGTFPMQSFGVPIPSDAGPPVASSIGVGFPGFSLTGHDSVTVPFEFDVVPVPEPASLVLLGAGLVGLRSAARRSRSR